MSTTYPNAKINIGLYITGCRPDGYHTLETVFYPIPLTDRLSLSVQNSPSDTSLTLQGIALPSAASDNLVIRAYQKLKELCPQLPPVAFTLDKRIPTGAGLGGGSADAAFALLHLNRMFKLGLSEATLHTLSTSLGADCPFFLSNRPSLAYGIGDRLEPVELTLEGYSLLLVKPDVFISTAEAFRCVAKSPSYMPLAEAIRLPVSQWRSYISNDFERGLQTRFPFIEQIKTELYRMGACYASLSGSGSTVYGLFAHPIGAVSPHFADCYCKVLNL